MDEKITKLFLPLLDKLYNTEPAGEPFRKPVDVVKYRCYDYYSYVKHPIDLSTIREQLVAHQYKDAWRFIADIQLMFSNAYLFNKKGTPVYEFTNKLNKIWTSEVTPIMQRLNYCCGTLHKFGPQLLFCHGTTPERYCQIPIGAKYKCYQDKYSFCLPCFNKIETDSINIQGLSCETTRMKLPKQPVLKSDFADCTNDNWQYETFIQCTQCSRRVHQICDIYPADKHEIESCKQHDEIEHEQKMLYRIPEEAQVANENQQQQQQPTPPPPSLHPPPPPSLPQDQQHQDQHKEQQQQQQEPLQQQLQLQPLHQNHNITHYRDKFLCNHCYRKKKIGFNLRHRKFSARRLPHTRMSKYIETKVNEHIRENSPLAGPVTIRVLTAYKDTVGVQPKMKDYIERCKKKDPSQQHPNTHEYPSEFSYTNRAIFAWQEIDNVDVCVFGMHVQEYGEDCPEPNKQVIYLSYLDSVHFFRPKQVRTAVYHEILLSYFKYMKKLGFRRVFIWVCPSRKGDDYIFYRHPTEQKMPTLRRLSDWYVNLLDKGVAAGIVEQHQNIYQYVATQHWTSILSMPYLSGDYWPGEFERLLQAMIDYEKEYEAKTANNQTTEFNYTRLIDPNPSGVNSDRSNNGFSSATFGNFEQIRTNNLTSTLNENPFHRANLKAMMHSLNMKPVNIQTPGGCFTPEGDFNSNISVEGDIKSIGAFTPELLFKSDYDQPLDLSKSSSNNSPESYFDDDLLSEFSFRTSTKQRNKKRKSSLTSGYTKKRNRSCSQNVTSNVRSCRLAANERFNSQPTTTTTTTTTTTKTTRQKSSTQLYKDSLISETAPLHPEQELIKYLERSLKRQKEGFIVARLNDCDCTPHFESQRRNEEAYITCELMKGREPFLQLTRQMNYEFSTLRRAKFSSLAMVKHLADYFQLEPICNECFSFDSSKRHYKCEECYDYYLCRSCHENTQHPHTMSLMETSTLPDIDEFLQQCSVASTTNSFSSASSAISSKSFNETTLELSPQSSTTLITRPSLSTNSSISSSALNRHLSTSISSSMPLTCHRHKNRNSDGSELLMARCENEENANICSFESKLSLSEPPPSHSANNIRNNNHHNLNNVELDHVLIENFRRQAEISYDIDFDIMKHESKRLLTHYTLCNVKETCHKCKFVVLSCSFMSALMRNTSMQTMVNCNPSEILPNNINNSNNHHVSGINLTTAHQFSYQSQDK